jgi:cytochrome c553
MERYSDRSTDMRSGIRSGRTSLVRGVGVATGAISLLIAVNSPCLAQGAVSPPGRLLASNCAQCHGATDAAPGFDRLTGKSASKLLRKMHKYQSGAEGEGIMTHHAMGYTDQQLRDLVQWLSQQR